MSVPTRAIERLRHEPEPTWGRALSRMRGARILVLNWRDITHPQTGGAETFIHETARRWVAAGASVTMLTARPPGRPAREEIDGIDVRRAGGVFGVYLRTALRLIRIGHRFDAVVDCQNGIPFFAPLFSPTPVVQVVHHVHQDQFATRFPLALCALGRFLEGPVARRVYREHRNVAVSASTRQEMRKRLQVGGIIDVVPNGLPPVTGAPGVRALTPTVAVVSRLVPHKRVDVLLGAVEAVRAELPGLRVEIIGDGPELDALRHEATRLDLDDTVTFHGRLPAARRDALVRSAWLTTSTSDAEGWGQAVLEAAAAGVPCVALRAAGVRDSIIDGRTGWLVDGPEEFASGLVLALARLARPADAAEMAAECRHWASCFTWDRSAEMLAASVLAQSRPRSSEPLRRRRSRRRARSDTTTVARFTHADPAVVVARLRLTDEIEVDGTTVTVVLRGCDDLDAVALLDGLGATDLEVRPAGRHELLGGPAAVGEVTTPRILRRRWSA